MNHKLLKPVLMFGLMIIGMIIFMIAFSLMFGGMNPMTMMYSSGNNLGLGMWGVMIIPLVGVIIMLVIMFLAFRWMTGSKGIMTMMMNQQQTSTPKFDKHNLTTLMFDIPAVNCAHCKMKIEKEIGAIPGVASVDVNIETRQALIKLVTPPTRVEIEVLLANIGYPAETI